MKDELYEDIKVKLTFLSQAENVVLAAFEPAGEDNFIIAVKHVHGLTPSEATMLWEIIHSTPHPQ